MNHYNLTGVSNGAQISAEEIVTHAQTNQSWNHEWKG